MIHADTRTHSTRTLIHLYTHPHLKHNSSGCTNPTRRSTRPPAHATKTGAHATATAASARLSPPRQSARSRPTLAHSLPHILPFMHMHTNTPIHPLPPQQLRVYQPNKTIYPTPRTRHQDGRTRDCHRRICSAFTPQRMRASLSILALRLTRRSASQVLLLVSLALFVLVWLWAGGLQAQGLQSFSIDNS